MLVVPPHGHTADVKQYNSAKMYYYIIVAKGQLQMIIYILKEYYIGTSFVYHVYW